MNLSMTLSPIMEKVKNGFEHILDPALLRDLARKTLFVQRKSSKLDGEEFAILMSVVGTSLAYQALAAWEEALEKIKPSARMSPQALSERIDNEKAVAFMKAVFAHTLNVSRQGVREALGVPFLDSFHRVIITDSTEFTLNAKLAPDFAGPGGSASSSAMKILHAADLKAGNSLLMEVLPALVPDQALAERIANIVEAGDLVLWDLGFFVLAEMKKIVAKEAFLLSRMSSDAAAFLAETGERLDLIKYLSRRCRGKNVVDLDVLIGVKEKIPFRLIATRAPKKAVEQRLRDARRKAAHKGKKPSKAHCNWLKFTIFITNIGRDQLPAKQALDVYRARWQEELTYKIWKSLLHIDIYKGERPERIECILYGRMIAILLLEMVTSLATVLAR
jgi:hypothetical protein